MYNVQKMETYCFDLIALVLTVWDRLMGRASYQLDCMGSCVNTKNGFDQLVPTLNPWTDFD